MRRYKTCCCICDIETRNTGKTMARPIDVCWRCHKESGKSKSNLDTTFLMKVVKKAKCEVNKNGNK